MSAEMGEGAPIATLDVREKAGNDIWRAAFLHALAEKGNVRAACRDAAIDRRAAYRARDSDPEFKQAWDDALEAACDLLEQEARRRALQGVRRYKFFEGKLIEIEYGKTDEDGKRKRRAFVEREYSDSLLMFLLRGHRPGRFSERVRQESTNLNVDLARLSTDQLERLAAGEDIRSVLAIPEGPAAAGEGGAGAETPGASAGPGDPGA